MDNDEYINLWTSLVHVKDAISKVRQRELKPFHISPEQSGVLATLWKAPTPPTPADIARSLFRDPSSVSIILNRMVNNGLIRKTMDKKNRNLIRVSLTNKGARIYNQILENMCVYRIISGLSKEQCQQLGESLDLLLARAQTELKTYKKY